MPAPSLMPGLRVALRLHEIGNASPYALGFAGKDKSGASFGFMQGDVHAGQAFVKETLRKVLESAAIAPAKVGALMQQLSGHLTGNPLSAADNALVNDALNAAAGRKLVDAMDERILAEICKDLDQCVAAANASGRTIAAKAQLYMAMWINMTGKPTRLLAWLSGQDVTMAAPVAKPGPVVDAAAMETYLGATQYYTAHPKNLKHIKECAAAGAKEIGGG